MAGPKAPALVSPQQKTWLWQDPQNTGKFSSLDPLGCFPKGQKDEVLTSAGLEQRQSWGTTASAVLLTRW